MLRGESAGASVTITDLGEVLPSIQMNVDANKTEGHELDVKVAFLFLHPCSDRPR